ncbi:glycosyltransferase family 2 protein [Halostagnicola kamekurae]|uniref:Glycosyltransferase involved in cell wall bisynthesis n=1 Tax=Halostagnicola kamekurae TaxID=619731 RepID=A0A1I6UG55_9EURY|nr:glycosyltransferase family 2 protein [Halostagnicola kamekurae]SFT00403.1 Glycosyltransferase involved in cell wall bisynthesis [Halostagnicola kamekurae]
MYRGKTIGVVVTAYNEESFVGEVIETVPAFVDRIYVVDDASPDGCWDVIQRVSARINDNATPERAVADGGESRRVVPIRHAENRGYGAAVKSGYERAVADGIDVVAVMNGDGQMDPEILDRIVDPVVAGEADYAKGNRLRNPGDRRGMSTFRFVGNALLTGLSKFSTGYWSISDPQNGYTAISSDAIEALDLGAVTDEYGFLNHLLTHLNVRGFRVADVPMRAVYGDEESSIRYVTFIRFVSTLLLRSFLWRLRVRYVRHEFHPAVLFYAAGSVGLLAGTAGFVGSVVEAARDGDGLTASMTAVLTLLVSTMSLAAAITMDAEENEALEVTYDERDSTPTGDRDRIER